MQRISFYLAFAFLWTISLLPMPVLFFFSDLLYIFVYHIVGYRKKVVFKNLRNSFPEKSDEEIKSVAKKFYKHFCDMFFETFKCLNISKKEIRKRITIKNPKFLDELYHKEKSIIAVFTHYANWEITLGIPMQIKHRNISIYKPQSNKYFNKLSLDIRKKFGMEMVAMKNTLRCIMEYQQKNVRTLVVFLSDQSPVRTEIHYRMNFLNQDTPVFLGVEKISRKLNQPVVFMDLKKVKRGYYSLEYVMLFENPAHTADYEITNRHMKYLEEKIKAEPAYWLWTHRRWKY
ncbi:MAG: hypothetical protein A2W91_16285 [Bacteroidetes bacterium GWF2_38_335]|nr:MAG: hypothetical protein A2W91_16285 [Bacteroidetes bacterium GWF2_38_335]OFY81248.1 MAG: hypothetical protein A2281_07260 [Bacteroidetes bacterium RIFOXYA12_FULL_38_20]HBS85365.1 hypothetical protein [Bacteroidales bacterium]